MPPLRVSPALLERVAGDVDQLAAAVADTRAQAGSGDVSGAFPMGSPAAVALDQMFRLWSRALDDCSQALESFAFDTRQAALAYQKAGDQAVNTHVVLTPFGVS